MKNIRVLISGGGTGGHIFPALSIANGIKERCPEAEILFVGAENRMEMEKVPAAGYKIIGLPVSGFDRRNLLRNFKVVYRLLKSMRLANKILRDFRPDIAVGVGGYASGPMLKAAQKKGIPTLIQEQNSYAGVTNKLLAQKAQAICVAYEGLERFFPADKIVLTGNPVRQAILNCKLTPQEARRKFGLDPEKRTVLVVGGSLGARTVNECIAGGMDRIMASDVQLIWQTGKLYDGAARELMVAKKPGNVVQMAFVTNMDEAYRAVDLVVSRAGASSISELQLLGKASLLVPSPNVAEDHQTKNAMALVERGAAVMVRDAEAGEKLVDEMLSLVADDKRLADLSENISKMALRNSVEVITDKVFEIIGKKMMKEMKDYNNIYFVGAGGIGMAALVRYFLSKGYRVAGYDRTRTALTDALEAEGAELCFEDTMEAIPDYCRDREHTLVVYTPAIPDSHVGLSYFRKEGFEVMKRAQVLGIISHGSKGLCFAGTHGKTTTSSMAAHILSHSQVGCNAFLGGVLRNCGTNFMLHPTSPYTVIEADEFDRSFHWLNPYIAVITATDPDHLDIYGTEEAYLESFAHFTELIRPDGVLICHTGLKLRPRPQEGVRVYSYSRNEGDFHATNVRKGDGEIVFDFVSPQGTIRDVKLGVPVDINIENAVAAMAVCQLVGATEEDMRAAVGSFLGAKRRFEFWLKEPGENGKVVIDDYAHHPDEL